MDWQPIATAPRDGSFILLSGEGRVSIGKYHEDKGQILIAAKEPYWDDYDHSYWDRYETDDSWFQPTHWMPLPAPAAPVEPKFTVEEAKLLAGMMVHFGPYPFEDATRDVKGRQVVVNGERRTIARMESHAKQQPPRKGDMVGLVFRGD